MTSIIKKIIISPAIILTYLSTFLTYSCRKDEVPALTTDAITNIRRTSVWCEGTLFKEGSDTLTSLGFCWSTGNNPSLADNSEVAQFLNEGNFQSCISELTPDTKYFVRAYATNRFGTSYGNQVSFSTKSAGGSILFNPVLNYGSVLDIDGNFYKTIKLGTQEWLAENLKTTRYNDGTPINLVKGPSIWIVYEPSYGWYEDNETVYKNLYGGYYNWAAVNTGKLCPAGWHIPSDEEWKVMEIFLGSSQGQVDRKDGQWVDAAKKIKECGTDFWVDCPGGTNEVGFTGLPGGSKDGGEGASGLWWTTTELDLLNHGDLAWIRYILCEPTIYRSESTKSIFINVRCLKDK